MGAYADSWLFRASFVICCKSSVQMKLLPFGTIEILLLLLLMSEVFRLET